MGSEVIARCKCGVNKKIRIGGGMRTFQHTQYFPFACFDCKDVVEANLISDPPVCSQCGGKNIVSYDDSSLIAKINDNIDVATNFGHVLYEGKYKCAKCEQDELEFYFGGTLWD